MLDEILKKIKIKTIIKSTCKVKGKTVFSIFVDIGSQISHRKD